MYKYSIIVPVYNSEKTLEKTIYSIFEQIYIDWELILIDDGSTDSSTDKIIKYASRDHRIRCVFQENSGPGIARNHGMMKATGDYIAFLDSDDYWENDFLKLVDDKASTEKLDVIFISMIHEHNDGKKIKVGDQFFFSNHSKDELIRCQMSGKMGWGMGKIIKRNLLDSVSGFSKLTVGEEAIFSFDVLNAANSFGFIEKPVYHYVYNINGQHKKGDNDPWNEVTKSMKKYLIKIGEYERYEKTINSLALNSLSIALFRYSTKYTYKSAIVNMKLIYKNYYKNYDFSKLDIFSLNKTALIILKLLKIKLFPCLYIISNIRKMITK